MDMHDEKWKASLSDRC